MGSWITFSFKIKSEWIAAVGQIKETEPQTIHRKYFTKHKPSDSYGQLDAKLNLGAVQWIDIHA